jgi:hypothetical protein
MRSRRRFIVASAQSRATAAPVAGGGAVTEILGAVLVTLLVAVLLLREAVGLGLLRAPDPARRTIDGSIVVLATLFATVVAVHLVSL